MSTADIRRQMTQGRKDDAGLPIDRQPHLSKQQLYWLASRLDCKDDREACEETAIDLEEVKLWKRGDQFRAMYEECLANKREAFRLLTAASLPQVLRVLLEKLHSSKSEKTQLNAASLILRVQALLIDKVQTYDRDEIQVIVSQLRQPGPVITVTPDSRPLLPAAAGPDGD